MLDHLGLVVTDLNRSRAFYEQALAPLGISVLMEITAAQTGGDAQLGLGAEGKAFFWIGTGGKPAGPVHVAFTASDRAQVDAFHQTALAAGGRDNGGPGLRPHYHPDYYGAFALDPDGNNVEAVCRKPA
jgi:catechol 2,3-dioxygenase-like lactoylglutathione lyase family enzyme